MPGSPSIKNNKMASISDATASSEGRDWKTILQDLPDYGLTVSFLGVVRCFNTFESLPI